MVTLSFFSIFFPVIDLGYLYPPDLAVANQEIIFNNGQI